MKRQNKNNVMLLWAKKAGSEYLRKTIAENKSWATLAHKEYANQVFDFLEKRLDRINGRTRKTIDGLQFIRPCALFSPTEETLDLIRSVRRSLRWFGCGVVVGCRKGEWFCAETWRSKSFLFPVDASEELISVTVICPDGNEVQALFRRKEANSGQAKRRA